MNDTVQHGAPPAHDESVIRTLASKILLDWLRNRHQLLVPLTLDLQKLEPQGADVLMQAMVCAADADGALHGADRARLDAALNRLNANPDQLSRCAGMIDHPQPLGAVLATVPDVQTGAMIYAASLLSIDRRKRVNRFYLRYLAERLKLPQDLSHSLEQRFNLGF